MTQGLVAQVYLCLADGAPAAEQDFDAMNPAELGQAPVDLGVSQTSVSIAELQALCKRAPGAAAKYTCEEAELGVGSSRALEAERDFDAMSKAELRKTAKGLGVPQKSVNVAELKAACKRAAGAAAKDTCEKAELARVDGERRGPDVEPPQTRRRLRRTDALS